MGSATFALPSLDAISEAGHSVAAIFTQPDKPSGRGQSLQPPPVKKRATELSLPVYQPQSLKTDETRELIGSTAPEMIVVVAYGKILPKWLLEFPKYGCLNLHGSLLPKYRGAAPIQWAIANGESITGVTTMRIDAGLDTGDILQQAEERILPEDTASTLAPRLAQTGAELMISTLAGLKCNNLTARPQDDSQSSLAPILKREDGLIDFSRTATDAWNRLRGFQPWPGAFTKFRGKMLRVHSAVPAPEVAVVAAGHFTIENERLLLGFAHGTSLDIQELQMEGKKRMSGRDFINGYRPKCEEEVGG